MKKQMIQKLALILVAAPLAIGACDKSDKNNDAGPVTNPDSAVGVDGSRADTGVTPDVSPTPADGGTISDTNLPGDAAVSDVSVSPDVSITVDAAQVPDVAPGDATADATPAVDTTLALVCTETTKFSGGTVTTDRTLSKACSPYTIKNDIDVNGNATLTIEPGVTLRFDTNKEISIGYSAAAKLVASGTAAETILFTSSNSTPGAGDWGGVRLWSNTMNGTILKNVKFDYCGAAADACLLGTGAKPNRVTVDHVIFSHVGQGADAIWQKDKDSNFTITSCTFSDIPTTPTQQYAISVFAPSFSGIDSTNVFNGGAMVQLMGGTVATNSTWKNIGTTVAVTGDVSVEGTATPVLTIAAGSEYKFASGIELAVGYGDPGSLSLVGTATAPITLTSLAGTRAAGDWVGISLWNSATATIKNATISFAGSDRGAINVVSNGCKLDIQDSKIVSSASYGIRVPCNSKANITNTNNTFTACASGDVGPGPTGDDCH